MEVLLLQPQVAMVVIITSTGGVSKRVFAFDSPVDPGLAEWAAVYLNEQLAGMGLGARMLHTRLEDPSLPPTERNFLTQLAPAFTGLAETAEDALYVDGAARLLREGDSTTLGDQRRDRDSSTASRCSRCSPALTEPTSTSGSAGERGAGIARAVVVAANYGLPPDTRRRDGDRPGAYGLRRAIRSVRAAAGEFCAFVEEVYGDS